MNQAKSSIAPATTAVLLGFGFFFTTSGVKIRVAPKAWQRAKARIRSLTSRRWSVAMEYRIMRLNQYVRGWMGYFRLADTPASSGIWMSGSAVDCAKSAGRNGNASAPRSRTCVHSGSGPTWPGNGA
ncbi:group II intron maturase-specific domain-containing protein [Mycobacterium bourgelatii]|uniref:group II intron maturase-specific domain-containing protein n=1 Tax=Mycobacterium bourgelatii TaxID=1273442 RepID=UPI001962700F|nr:group II intron maturase-specific domain-containing protein [Mycobacterium bourgelatii]